MPVARDQYVMLVPVRHESVGTPSGIRWRFHLFTLGFCCVLLAVILVCSRKNPVTNWESPLEATAALLPISAIPALLWQDRKDYVRRDAALALPWTFVLVAMLPIAAVLSAQLRFPLRDALFAAADRALGFNDPSIVVWSELHRPIGAILDRSYSLLSPLLASACFLPALTGRRAAAERFVLSNVIAFLASFPLFAFLPAVGPWFGYHFPGNEPQLVAETAILALHSGATASQMAGLLTFPSFHVIWAVLSAWALWSIKPLRILAVIVAVLVVISTVTTGWHYVADVIAGLIISAASGLIANQIIGKDRAPLNTPPAGVA
jgi:membrane-associated phospholipid phosphatase